jgi:ATP-binding cassette, subfamily B, bacterial
MNNKKYEKNKSILSILKPYSLLIVYLVILTIVGNALNLVVPKIVSGAIDSYSQNKFDLQFVVIEFFLVSVSIFVFIYLQSIMQTYVSEKVARDLRTELADKISRQDFNYIQSVTPSKLLTNLTSDVDAVKWFVSQAITSVISSIFLIIWASILLFMINWQLALAVLAIVPIIWISFWFILSKVRKLFKASQETIDWLNKIINESILGSSLIRILNSQTFEYNKFLEANAKAKDIWMQILNMFATLIPIITFTSNMAILVILMLWGHYVIIWNMTLWDFAAFNGYLSILIFPIIIIWFMSWVIAQASASYLRIYEIISMPEKIESWKIVKNLDWDIHLKNIDLKFWEKMALKDVSFNIIPWSKTAIIWPTAAWKTQLLCLLTWLINPTSWTISYDWESIEKYDKVSLHEQIWLVFQDSNMFNLTIRENIAFSNTVSDKSLEKAIETAELFDFVDQLPDKLDTIVSERWTSLSWWQKQRIMLARALALNPKILFLDDFTARLESKTESKILANVYRNYPGITLVSVTQKIESIKDYDQIVLLMEWEVLAIWKHEELLENSPEYIQIYNSQFSTNNYELQAK